MHFETVFTHIGDLLRILTTLDLIIQQQTHLKDDWNVYKRFLSLSIYNRFFLLKNPNLLLFRFLHFLTLFYVNFSKSKM